MLSFFLRHFNTWIRQFHHNWRVLIDALKDRGRGKGQRRGQSVSLMMRIPIQGMILMIHAYLLAKSTTHVQHHYHHWLRSEGGFIIIQCAIISLVCYYLKWKHQIHLPHSCCFSLLMLALAPGRLKLGILVVMHETRECTWRHCLFWFSNYIMTLSYIFELASICDFDHGIIFQFTIVFAYKYRLCYVVLSQFIR